MAKSPASISLWLEDLKNGKEDVGVDIWNRYMTDLIALSQRKLGTRNNRHSDEEDVAICAFNALLTGIRDNRFPKLDSREDLWQVLVMLTERKAVDQIRRHKSKKRGAGQVRGESFFQNHQSNQQLGIANVRDVSPTPEFAVQFREEVQNCLDKLKDAELGKIVLLKLEGYRNQEIAEQFDLSISTIERKLRLIRKIWSA